MALGTATAKADMQLQIWETSGGQSKGTLGLVFSLTRKRKGFISAWGKKLGKRKQKTKPSQFS